MIDRAPDSLDEIRALPESGGHLSKDAIYSLLSSARRRYVIQAMLNHEGEYEFSRLVRTVAVREYGDSPDYRQRKRIYVSLRQTHLPALDDAGVVQFNSDRGNVARDENFEVASVPVRLLGRSQSLLPAVPFSTVDIPPSVGHRAVALCHHLVHYGV